MEVYRNFSIFHAKKPKNANFSQYLTPEIPLILLKIFRTLAVARGQQ